MDQKLFENMSRVDRSLNLANNESTKISGTGNVKLPVIAQGYQKTLTIENVLYVSDLRTNLLSVSRIADRAMKCNFAGEMRS